LTARLARSLATHRRTAAPTLERLAEIFRGASRLTRDAMWRTDTIVVT
jgi:hypothetical protein